MTSKPRYPGIRITTSGNQLVYFVSEDLAVTRTSGFAVV
jgi:hypothetical protein